MQDLLVSKSHCTVIRDTVLILYLFLVYFTCGKQQTDRICYILFVG